MKVKVLQQILKMLPNNECEISVKLPHNGTTDELVLENLDYRVDSNNNICEIVFNVKVDI